METLPQIQTIISEYAPPLSTVIDAPWVSVTSVNGMTGDVVVEVKLNNFEPHHFYYQNTAVIHNGSLYYAKEDFTSGDSFDINDWNYPRFAQEQANWTETDATSNAYIQNKPTKLSQFENDLDTITEEEVNTLIGNQISTLITETIDPLSGKVTGLETDVDGLGTRVSGIDDSVSGLSDEIGTVSNNVATLSNTVSNLKTDGSVTKLGTSTIGSEALPVFWSNGEPKSCATGLWNSVVTTDDSGNTAVGSTLRFNRNASGTITPNIRAAGTSLVTSSGLYRSSTSSGNEFITRSENDWMLVNSQTLTSAATGRYPLSLSIPYEYRGYGWEYKVIIGAEFSNTGMVSFCLGRTVGDEPFYINATSRLNFMKSYKGAFQQYESGGYNSFACGFEWYLDVANDSFAATILISKAGSGNHWNFNCIAGGISNGQGSVYVGGGRAGWGDDITGMCLRSSSTSMNCMAGSHIEIFGRQYA